MKVVLDPGHGGSADAGRSTAVGVRGLAGTLEKDVTFALAELVAKAVGHDVCLTREADENLPLASRAALARQRNAPVFVSIHANGGRPGERGVETWTHEEASEKSTRLAKCLQRNLSPLLGPDRGVKKGPMAVLTPSRHAEQTAACSVELDFLDDPDGEQRLSDQATLGQIASAIAKGIGEYLSGSNGQTAKAAARALEDEGYFTDTEELGEYLNDTRAADTKMVSSRDDARLIVQNFRASGGGGAWPSLDRAEVADRLIALIDDPRLIQQASLNLCGPAAFLCMWNARDPVAFANYATELFETGAGKIGSLTIRPRDNLRERDYAQMLTRMQELGGANPQAGVSPQADWMTMGAIRNADDVFWQWTGDPDQLLAALTTPEELTDWLKATGIYRSVKNGANWVKNRGVPHATNLVMAQGTDIALLINANVLVHSPCKASKGKKWILNQFPNHYIVLLNEPVQDVSTHEVTFNAWSWGETCSVRAPQKAFIDNYYGAVIARLK